MPSSEDITVSTIISVVPLPNLNFVVWFNGGVTKIYRADTFDITDVVTHNSVIVASEGKGLVWGDGTYVDIDRLIENGAPIDFVAEEKRRLLKDLGEIRREATFSQTRLGDAAGIRQSVISRIEGCEISPQINTLLKLLAPLGKTLKIVDLNES